MIFTLFLIKFNYRNFRRNYEFKIHLYRNNKKLAINFMLFELITKKQYAIVFHIKNF